MMKHNDFLRAAAALTVTLGLAAAPHAVSAPEASPFDPRQSEAIERLVQQYPPEHPEVPVEAPRRSQRPTQAAGATAQAAPTPALAGTLPPPPPPPRIGHPPST